MLCRRKREPRKVEGGEGVGEGSHGSHDEKLSIGGSIPRRERVEGSGRGRGDGITLR